MIGRRAAILAPAQVGNPVAGVVVVARGGPQCPARLGHLMPERSRVKVEGSGGRRPTIRGYPDLLPSIQIGKPVRSAGRIEQLFSCALQRRTACQQRVHALLIIRGIRREINRTFNHQFNETFGRKGEEAKVIALLNTPDHDQKTEWRMKEC
jgi:hypothetical protein